MGVTFSIGIMHVPGTRERELARLRAATPSAFVMDDHGRMGAWATARRCWLAGIVRQRDWIVVLNDDAAPCANFEPTLSRALEGCRGDIVCLFTAHPRAKELKGGGWYTTVDGLVGVGCAMRTPVAEEFLAWHDKVKNDAAYPDDARVNLFAIATGRRVWTTVPSLVEHSLPDQSMVGHEHDACRVAVAPPDGRLEVVDWDGEPVHFGLQYQSNWGHMFRQLKPRMWTPDLVDAVYVAARGGDPVATNPTAFLATPNYQAPCLEHLRSRTFIVQDLLAHGIGVLDLMAPGDSLVTRARARILNTFLKSSGTHLVWLDNDVSADDPACIREMMATGHPVIAGAVPFKETGGRIVANLRAEDLENGHLDMHNGAVRAQDVGCGVQVVERGVLYELICRHPETLHWSLSGGDRGEPLFQLYGEAIEDGILLSEDWCFARRCQRAGISTWLAVDQTFAHHGAHAYRGSLREEYGLR